MRVTLTLLLLASLALPATTAAARKPTPRERTQLSAAIRSYVDTSDCCAVITKIRIVQIRVSTVDPRWASVMIEGWDESGHAVGGAAGAVHRGYLTGTWSVRAFGSSKVGCPMPAKVRRDLRLDC